MVSAVRAASWGLSPPTRGSQDRWEGDSKKDGSIPAHAGEPLPVARNPHSGQVYPRPRGGAISADRMSKMYAGLSPPTRGSRLHLARHCRLRRSIPAHAGEPRCPCPTDTPPKVYPRPRGGARCRVGLPAARYGLSPPTRGSRRSAPTNPVNIRSIPAHAGEPIRPGHRSPEGRVYPRPRGGAQDATSARRKVWGLSPPTRGSRGGSTTSRSRSGSIPAHAGEPESYQNATYQLEVYPRPRGGALDVDPHAGAWKGLSPPTRGSRLHDKTWEAMRRSIPAHAGEPRRPLATRLHIEVYPRPRGGAAPDRAVTGTADGLSPPTRGSPCRHIA